MALLKIYGGQALQAALNEIVSPVLVTYLALEAPEPDTMAALEELRALTSYLSVVSTQADGAALADQVTVQGSGEQMVTFTGAPVGTELAALVSAIVVTGRGDSGLSLHTRQALARLSQPVYLEIFTTPT